MNSNLLIAQLVKILTFMTWNEGLWAPHQNVAGHMASNPKPPEFSES